MTMTRRAPALALAVVLAMLATGALVSYVRGLESKALRGAETVQVYVAKDTIPAGMTGDSAISKGLVDRVAVPRKVLAEGVISSLDEIRGKAATVTIVKGEQIVGARFGLAGEGHGMLAIPADRQAMSVEVDTPPGVSGFIQPGDHISVIAQIAMPAKQGTEPHVQYLLQDVPVLAVGQRSVTSTDAKAKTERAQPTDKVLLTLALTPADAEKLAFALFQGQVYFTLLPPGQAPAATPGRTTANAFR